MLPAITITDAPTAFLIAEALRAQADAKRRVAANALIPSETATRLLAHAQRLDSVAKTCKEQGESALILDAADYADTIVIPRVSIDQLAIPA